MARAIDYEWRGSFEDPEVSALHAEGFAHDSTIDQGRRGHRRRQGVGAALVAAARDHVRAAGCQWLHVDFEDHLRAFYFDACGFTPTNAGLIAL